MNNLFEAYFSGTFLEPSVDQRFTRNVDKMKTIIKEKLEVSY